MQIKEITEDMTSARARAGQLSAVGSAAPSKKDKLAKRAKAEVEDLVDEIQENK